MANQPTNPPQLGGKQSGPPDINYLANYEGVSGGSAIEVTEGGVTLPPQPCKYVLISNWNVSNDAEGFTYRAPSGDNLYENAGFELYYGFKGVYVCQLFPGSNSFLIPVNNTKQICLRTRPGVTLTAWFAWFY